MTINRASLTITASSPAMTYGGTVPAITPGYAGFVNGDSASVALTTPPTCSTTATARARPRRAAYTSSCSGAADANYTISYGTGSVTVDKAPLTVTASSPAMTYGGTVPAITAGYAGFVNGDSASSLSAKPTCSTTATGSDPVSPPTYPSSCSGAADPNYTIGYAGGSVTINQAPLTITASSASMTYGGTVAGIIPSYSGFVNGDGPGSLSTAPTCTTTATSSSPASPPAYTSSCSGASDANYTISYGTGSVTIRKAPLSVTASSGSMAYGGAVPAIAPSYSGFVNGDGPGSLSTAPTCTTTATSSSPVSGSPYLSSCAGAVDAQLLVQLPHRLRDGGPRPPYDHRLQSDDPVRIRRHHRARLLGLRQRRHRVVADDKARLHDDGDQIEPRLRFAVCIVVQRGGRPELRDRLRDRLGDGQPGSLDHHRFQRDDDLRLDTARRHGFLRGLRQR